MIDRPTNRSWFARVAGPATVIIFAASCGSDQSGPTTDPPHPASVVVDPSTVQLVVAQTSQLSATVKDASGKSLSGFTVSWASGSNAVATVSSGGVVSGVAPGTVTITADYQGIHGSATVTVLDGAVVGAAGSEVTGVSGKVSIQIPAQALSAATTITIVPVASPPANPNLVPGTAYEFGPSGTQFGQPVTIRIHYDPAVLAVGAAPATFRLHRWSGTAWQPIPNSTVDTAAKIVTGQTNSFSTYAVLAVPVPIASLTLSVARVDLGIGEIVPVTAVAKDADGHVLSRTIDWSSDAAGIATVSSAGVVTGVTAGSTIIHAAAEGKTADLPVTVYTVNPELIEERILSQDGLAIALASNVLQSQLYIALSTMDGPTGESQACTALEGGGSYQTLPVGAAAPNQVGVYFDALCTKPYIHANVTLSPDNTSRKVTLHGVNAYTGLTGQSLGTLTVDETLLIPEHGPIVVHGLGVFVPANGAAPVQLGLECAVTRDDDNVPCAGGIAQDFSSIGRALGTVTPLTLTISPSNAVTFVGGGPMFSGPIGSLTLTAPTETTMEIHGGSVFATNVASGGAATFSLFPPTPTGWTLTDQAHDRKFQIDVVSNTVRNLVGHITEISTGRILATLTLDQSGTGTITYSDASTQPVTSWLLAN